jgi:hypothetical protein
MTNAVGCHPPLSRETLGAGFPIHVRDHRASAILASTSYPAATPGAPYYAKAFSPLPGYPRPMLIKARLQGHEFDLLSLAELFREGDPAVAGDDEGYCLSFTASEGF